MDVQSAKLRASLNLCGGCAPHVSVQSLKKSSSSSQSSQQSAEFQHQRRRQELPNHRRGHQLRSQQHQLRLQERGDRALQGNVSDLVHVMSSIVNLDFPIRF